MNENEEHTDLTFEPEDDIEVETDKALTMRAERLAGSPTCLNCGTGLKGPFCYYCGQPDRNFFRFFPALLRELMSDFLDLDSRFARTMKPLLFKPGTGRSYSNAGYIVLGAVVAGASGMSYTDYLQKHIFNPAGMADSGQTTMSCP